jgi:hypothetical protein
MSLYGISLLVTNKNETPDNLKMNFQIIRGFVHLNITCKLKNKYYYLGKV